MLKGINQQVIEICETGSPYFVRAFYFVNPAYSELNERRLRAEAEKLLPHGKPTARRRRRGKKRRLLWAALALFGVALSIVGVFLAALYL